MSTPLSLSPASAPIPLTKLSNDHNLRNPALSQSKARKSMKSRKSWTPGSGGVNYGTLLFVGWSHSDNMWLPHMEVHAPAVVEEFHLQHPDAPHSSAAPTPTASHCP